MGDDKQRYRVTFICKCAADYAEGYGATIDEAEANVRRFFMKDHGRAKPRAVTYEEVSTDGTHYEEIDAALIPPQPAAGETDGGA